MFNHLVIIDTNHLASRHRHMNGELKNDEGHRSGVVYGVLQSVRKLIMEQRPNHIIVVFDWGKSLRKQQIRDTYKKRKPPEDPEELQHYYNQLAELQTILPLLGLHVCKAHRVEADDIIGIITRLYPAIYGFDRVTILSADSDLLQLLTESITMLDEINQRTWTPETLLKSKKYAGFTPIDVISLKALVGDSSDNIEGCPGIGDKTARYILDEIKNLEEIYEEGTVERLVAGNPRCKCLLESEVIEHLKENVELIRIPTGVLDLCQEERISLGIGLQWTKPEVQDHQFKLYAAKWGLVSIMVKGPEWIEPFNNIQMKH